LKKSLLVFLTLVLSLSVLSGCKSNKKLLLNPVFGKVDIKSDVVYGTAKNEREKIVQLKLDLYQPKGDRSVKRPLIVWIHGGGFKGGDKKNKGIVKLCYAFAKRGYVTVSINYRLREAPVAYFEDAIRDAVTDTRNAIDFLKENAEKYRIDIGHIIVGGSSAGGITALYTAYTDNWDKTGLFAVIDLWGALFNEDEMTGSDPSVIIIHGTNDNTVPYKMSLELVDKLKENGILYEIHPIEGAGHAPWNHINEIISWVSHFLFNLIEKERSF